MTPKPNDKARLDFLGQCAWRMVYDAEAKHWKIYLGAYTAIGKTLRKAADEAIKWSNKAG